MAVRRVVANIAGDRLDLARAFYGNGLGMAEVMNLGFIMTYAGEGEVAPMLSIASEGGSGAPVPDLSIEVDALDEVLERLRANGVTPEYGPVTEPWGVRRFFVRDPFGKLINILEHGS